jgi:hypothetical protein
MTIEMYVRYCRLIEKHFNWKSEYGEIVQDCNFTWYDTFSNVKCMRPEIHFDIFCCYYNLGILYLDKAIRQCDSDIPSKMKGAI